MTDSETNTKFDRPTFLLETKSLRDILNDLRRAEIWLMLAAVAAFLASAFFVVKYFVGGVMDPTIWTGEQWANAMLGLGITAVITASQALLYASGYKGPAAVVATFIVVFFGLFSEVSQSMEREDATVRQRSESSPVFQAALGGISTLTKTARALAPSQQALADASGQLQYWEQLKSSKQSRHGSVKYSHKTIERNIARYQGEVASLQNQSAQQSQNQAVMLSGLINQAKSLEYDEDKHYAMIRLIRSLLGVAGIWASFLFSVIIIGTFEYAFHFVGAYVADHKRALLMMGRDAQGELIQPAGNDLALAGGLTQASIPRDHANGVRSQYIDSVSPGGRTGTVSAGPANAKTHQGEQEESKKNSISADPGKTEVTDARPDPPRAPVRDLTRERFFKLIYLEVRTRILNGELKPTVRPVTDAVTDVIRHHTKALGLQPALIGKPERQKIAEKVLERLQEEAVLEFNKEQRIGKPKYVLASRWASRPIQEIPSAG